MTPPHRGPHPNLCRAVAEKTFPAEESNVYPYQFSIQGS